jgi:tetratricopeptide (TPR) repeat protein
MNRQERRAAARKSGSSPERPANPTPAALYELGLSHLRNGRVMDAQVCCQQALAIDGGHADSCFLMGLLAIEAGDCDHAVNWFARALGQAVKIDYLFALGTALRRLQRFDDASKAFDKVIQLKPDSPQAWKSLANVLAEAGRIEESLLAWQHVLKIDPTDQDAAYQCFEKSGHLLHGLKRFEEALGEHQQAHAIAPANPTPYNNIGASLQSLQRHEEAIVWFERAIALQSDSTLALRNKAVSLIQLGRFDEAVAILGRVRASDPGNADAEWDLSLLQLMTGDFEAGWAGREARWRGKMRPASYPAFPQPRWLGDADIEGKTVLVQEDEGLGDTLQFARYIPLLAARGARVILVVRDQLIPLLADLPGVAQCISPKSATTLPPFDLHCPVCSLPLAFQTRLDTIPADVPYLPAPSEDRTGMWRKRLEQKFGGHERLRVGLVWSGNPQHDNDHNRSIPLQTLLPITGADAAFVSLQKELRAGDDALLAQGGIVDLTSQLTDFAETAALLACLDLVITVDTSVAHLAGALARPTWLLLPFVPDYRWLLGRDDSPWYPTLRLFRQSQRGDWGPVIDRVRRELAGRITARP